MQESLPRKKDATLRDVLFTVVAFSGSSSSVAAADREREEMESMECSENKLTTHENTSSSRRVPALRTLLQLI